MSSPGLSSGLKQLPVLIPADKYKNAEQLSIKDKINRINTHSIAKKTARISQHFKHEAGITPKVSQSRPGEVTRSGAWRSGSDQPLGFCPSSWWMKSLTLWRRSSTFWNTASCSCWRTWRCSCTTSRYVRHILLRWQLLLFPLKRSSAVHLVAAQRFLACRTEEFDFDMDGEKEAICFKEISTALRQWILPEFVSLHRLQRDDDDAAQSAGTPVLPRRKRG